MKSVAILQPYFFPYIGHLQLIEKADCLVIYDDVNYFKKGYINRNYLLHNNTPVLYTLPINKVSQNKKINELSYNFNDDTLVKKIKFLYKNKKNLESILNFINKIYYLKKSSVSHINTRTLIYILRRLKIKKKIIFSSKIKKNNQLKGQDKIIEICKKIDAENYINLIGGKKLYDQDKFMKNNLNLLFLKPELVINEDFVYHENEICNLSSLHHVIFFDRFQMNEKIAKGHICA